MSTPLTDHEYVVQSVLIWLLYEFSFRSPYFKNITRADNMPFLSVKYSFHMSLLKTQTRKRLENIGFVQYNG